MLRPGRFPTQSTTGLWSPGVRSGRFKDPDGWVRMPEDKENSLLPFEENIFVMILSNQTGP